MVAVVFGSTVVVVKRLEKQGGLDAPYRETVVGGASVDWFRQRRSTAQNEPTSPSL